MASFEHDGYRIAYEIHGEGVPVVLLHGLCVSFAGNFAAWGWIERLTSAGCQVIGMDFRGHGKSDKPRQLDAYGTRNLASDVLALLDHLRYPRASLLGYSLGSTIALHLLYQAPERIGHSVLMATGDGLLGHPPFTPAEVSSQLSNALSNKHFPEALPTHVSAYWTFAVKIGGDRRAAYAASQADYPAYTSRQVASIRSPVLVVSGENDPVLGRGPRLAKAIPRGLYVEVPGADHFILCRHEVALSAVEDFFRTHNRRDDI